MGKKTSHFSSLIFQLLMLFCISVTASAQVGEHRNLWSIGVNGGYNINNITFLPEIQQKGHTGFTGGLTVRYTCEKYFNTICSVQAEFNYSQLGWNEDILDINDEPVPVSPTDPTAQAYKRTINYFQVPFFAHLAWGKEKQGFNFFINAGPQFGFYLSESSEATLAYNEDGSVSTAGRVNGVKEQYTMPVENKFDYGIAAGLGVEAHIKHVGRIQLEGRYYYGLANIYGDSKRDYFAQSAHGTITIKAAYLFDL